MTTKAPNRRESAAKIRKSVARKTTRAKKPRAKPVVERTTSEKVLNSVPKKKTIHIKTTPELDAIMLALSKNPELAVELAKRLAPDEDLEADIREEQYELGRMCIRHRDEYVKQHQNCPHCIKICKLEQERFKNMRFVPPCPQCGNKILVRVGGTLKRLNRPGVFACGNCQISYTSLGEITNWGKNDAKFH